MEQEGRVGSNDNQNSRRKDRVIDLKRKQIEEPERILSHLPEKILSEVVQRMIRLKIKKHELL